MFFLSSPPPRLTAHSSGKVLYGLHSTFTAVFSIIFPAILRSRYLYPILQTGTLRLRKATCFTNVHGTLARVHTQTLAAPAVWDVCPKLASLQNVRHNEGRSRALDKGPALMLQRQGPRALPSTLLFSLGPCLLSGPWGGSAFCYRAGEGETLSLRRNVGALSGPDKVGAAPGGLHLSDPSPTCLSHPRPSQQSVSDLTRP